MIKQDTSENQVKDIYLGIGSNLGDKKNNIEKAKFELIQNNINILQTSNYYESLSWPDSKKPKFLNVVLKISSFFSPIVAPGSFAAAMPITKAAIALGGALVLSGVSDMLFPLPKPKEFSSEQDPQVSFSFSGTQNTSTAGTPVPLVYGEIVTGSVVISGSVDTQQVQA